jgi:hypothetical protein
MKGEKNMKGEKQPEIVCKLTSRSGEEYAPTLADVSLRQHWSQPQHQHQIVPAAGFAEGLGQAGASAPVPESVRGVPGGSAAPVPAGLEPAAPARAVLAESGCAPVPTPTPAPEHVSEAVLVSEPVLAPVLHTAQLGWPPQFAPFRL